MDKIDFISSAYDHIHQLQTIDPMFAEIIRGKPLVPHLHGTINKTRTVTIRIKGQSKDYGIPAVFSDPLGALSFYNAVLSGAATEVKPKRDV